MTEPQPSDQAIGTGDGEATAFQLVKIYGSAHAPWTRTIVKPVAGTVRIAVDGAELTDGWSVDAGTGIVTFDAPPAPGAPITAGYAFDVPVRFDTDSLDVNLAAFTAGEVPSIPLVELRM